MNKLFSLILILSVLPIAHLAGQSIKENTSMIRQWNKYIQDDIDSCLVLSNNIAFSEKFSIDQKYLGKLFLGSYCVRKGEILDGILLLNEALIYFTQVQDHEIICRLYNEIGIGYNLLGSHREAEKYFKLSMESGRLTRDPRDSFLAQLNLAKGYIEQEKTELAKYHINQYRDSCLKYEAWSSLSNAYGVLFDFVINQSFLKSAQKIAQKQLNFAIKSNSNSFMTNAITNQGILYYYQNKTDSSLACFEQVLQNRKKDKNLYRLFDAYFNLAGFYSDQNPEFTKKYIDSAYRLALENKFFGLSIKALEFKINALNEKNASFEIVALKDSTQFYQNTLNSKINKIKEKLNFSQEKQQEEDYYFILYAVVILLSILSFLYRIKVRNP